MTLVISISFSCQTLSLSPWLFSRPVMICFFVWHCQRRYVLALEPKSRYKDITYFQVTMNRDGRGLFPSHYYKRKCRITQKKAKTILMKYTIYCTRRTTETLWLNTYMVNCYLIDNTFYLRERTFAFLFWNNSSFIGSK